MEQSHTEEYGPVRAALLCRISSCYPMPRRFLPTLH